MAHSGGRTCGAVILSAQPARSALAIRGVVIASSPSSGRATLVGLSKASRFVPEIGTENIFAYHLTRALFGPDGATPPATLRPKDADTLSAGPIDPRVGSK